METLKPQVITGFLKSRWVLLVTLALFVLFKIPHLLIPFYWDECWPYAVAVKQMYTNGVSLLPGAIDPNVSRGHPLFFHSAGAVWMHLFGTSNLALHSFALFVSLLFLATVYEAGLRIFNARVATIALLLTATRVAFFVQSSFVLPEIMVAFLSFLSIYLYTRDRFVLATLSLSALFLTKESGLIAGFVIGIDALVSFFSRESPLKTRLLRFLPTVVATALMGSFLLIQKHKMGWYVLPLHTDTILNNWSDIWYRFGASVLEVNFCHGHQVVIFIALAIFAVIMIVKSRRLKYLPLLALVPLMILVSYLNDSRISSIGRNDPHQSLITQSVFLLFIALYVFNLLYYGRRQFYSSDRQRRLVLLLGFFMLCYFLFSSVAYFIPRYQLASSLPVLFLLAVFLDMLIRHSYKVLYYPLLAVMAITAFISFKESKGSDDCSMGFTQGIKVQMATAGFLERGNYYDSHIVTNSYMEYLQLRDPATGFLSSAKHFNNVGVDITPATEVLVYSNIEQVLQPGVLANDPRFQLVYKITAGAKWGEIYIRKP